jgi:hypothetical protein
MEPAAAGDANPVRGKEVLAVDKEEVQRLNPSP